ncbi:MAG: DAK2 domain-containing protein [Thermoflexales bacterium]|nr:DAK2 domain-containing protein [Thermoflexales bacterium]
MSDEVTQTRVELAQPPGSPEPKPQRARLTMDGRRLKELVKAGYDWLRQQEEVVNGYNVYPVPDGDTGTNMMHTMRSAWEAIAGMNESNVGLVAKAISNGALRGSRGNSGIILSQLWRGFARSLDHKEICDAQDLVAAMQEAAKTAYAGVSTPVEGTILTVARETAEAVAAAARHTHDMRRLLEVAKNASYESVQRTPNLLKILKEAGVIDSGGYGLFVILEGMWRFVNGLPVEDASRASSTVRLSSDADLQHEGGWGYDVQYLIYARSGQALDVAKIRADIEAMGDCPLVLGDENIVKVHVHVSDPGVPISYGARLGSLRDVVVEDMQAQSEAFTAQTASAPAPKPEENLPVVETAMIAVASGNGWVRAFKEVGVRVVVEGGQTMNPSVDDLLRAIARANARSVILLPNNGNIVMTAQQAAEISETPTRIVATRTLAQGIAAAIAFNPSADAEENAAAMGEAAQHVTTGEITLATRDVTINGLSVRAGQVIGLIDDKLAVADDGIASTLLALLEKAGAAGRELITLFYGNGLTEAEAAPIAEVVRQAYPSHQVELIAGDQPHYYFIVSIE